MTIEERRKYKLAHYYKNKEAIQRERVTTGLLKGTRKIKQSTLEKYGINIDKDNNIVLPKKQKIVFDKSNIEASANTDIINIVVKKNVPIENYNSSNTNLNASELKNFVATVLKNAPLKEGSDLTLGVIEINQYLNIPDVLFKLHNEKYDALKDLTPWLSNTKELIDIINSNSKWKTDSSRAKFLGRILKLRRLFQPLKNRMSQNTYDELDAQYRLFEGIATIKRRTKSSSTLFYSFDAIKSEVLRVFGQKSYENLLMLLYDHVIARDDFQLVMAYSKSDMVSSDVNYLIQYLKTRAKFT